MDQTLSKKRKTAEEDIDINSIRNKYDLNGQGHVFQFFDRLDDKELQRFIHELKAIDLEKVNAAFNSAFATSEVIQDTTAADIRPVQNISSVANASEQEKKKWFDTGLEAIASGKVAAVILSGGQGTRLGFDGPKGCYDIGMPSHKSLFQFFSERIARLLVLAREKRESEESTEVPVCSLPFYIMTSAINDQATRDFFAEHQYFGLPEQDVYFFCQGMLPCLTFDGKIILEKADVVSQAPAGNGDIYIALQESGALADMEKRGVEHLHVFSVDNAICKVADPLFMGYCIGKHSDCGIKVVWKKDINEKVGVCIEKAGKPIIVEYSEMPGHLNEMVDSSGRVIYGAGNICNHYFTVAFIRDTVLPNLSSVYHFAKKKIPFADCNGETVQPDEANGIKLEAFIFDVFPMSSTFTLLEVNRSEEFTPVKNSPGSLSDTPEAACKALSDVAKKWMTEAGAIIEGQSDSICEVSPLVSYSGESLTKFEGKVFGLPFFV